MSFARKTMASSTRLEQQSAHKHGDAVVTCSVHIACSPGRRSRLLYRAGAASGHLLWSSYSKRARRQLLYVYPVAATPPRCNTCCRGSPNALHEGVR